MFPVSIYQGVSMYKYTRCTFPRSRSYADVTICVRPWPVRSFRTPLIVQRYLTAVSFMPGHSLTRGHLGIRPPLTAVICHLNRAIYHTLCFREILRPVELRPVCPAVNTICRPGDIHCDHRPVPCNEPHLDAKNVDDNPP